MQLRSLTPYSKCQYANEGRDILGLRSKSLLTITMLATQGSHLSRHVDVQSMYNAYLDIVYFKHDADTTSLLSDVNIIC